MSACEIYCENVRDLLTFMNSDGGQGAPRGAGGTSSKSVPKRTTSLRAGLFGSGNSKVHHTWILQPVASYS